MEKNISILMLLGKKKVVGSFFSKYLIKNVSGYKQVNSVVVQSLGDKELETISCDLLAHSGGWNPVVHLHSQSRGTVKFNDRIASFVPDYSIQNSIILGHVTVLLP